MKKEIRNENKFYESNILPYLNLLSIKNKSRNLSPSTEKRNMHIIEADELFNESLMPISYITDLHLDHKIAKKYPNSASKKVIKDFIKDIIVRLKKDFDNSKSKILLIGGDVSFNFSLSEIFYSELRDQFGYRTIYAVLGNHELWDIKLGNSLKANIDPIDFFVNKYKKMLEKYNIELIQNELLIYSNSITNDSYYQTLRLNEDEIMNMPKEQIRHFVRTSCFTILGGLGFSGHSTDYNATHGIYRDAVKNIESDMKYTSRFEKIHQKLTNILEDKNVIVLTHTPKDNWTLEDYCSNWIYVNGHTHHNYFVSNDDLKLYADNQIGYYNSKIRLKHFYVAEIFDLFQDYADGIYLITREDYLDFYRGRGNYINYNRENTEIYMLKKKGIYCFIQKNVRTMNLSILNGGAIKNLDAQNNLNYYFDHLYIYADAVNHFMRYFNNKLEEISMFIKSFGGSGRIHGSIVDIDYYNHVYLNPIDGKITSYYATSIIDKYVFENLGSLLFCKNKKLYDKFNTQISSSKTNQLISVVEFNNLQINNKGTHITDTSIYSWSRYAKSLQYLSQIDVIRTWDERLFEKFENKETNDRLFMKFIEDSI